ncbi:MAG: PAS domain-containing protein [Verrucomicrobia bacterium]|jgi:signal transduction histidine kinase|nr:PAS domain-containing protein [Verrucomicrobiota bacterium]
MTWKRLKRSPPKGRAVGAVAEELMSQLGTVVFSCDGAGGYPRISSVPAWLYDFAPEESRIDDIRDLPFDFLGVFLDACDEALPYEGALPPLSEIWHERDRAGVEHSFSIRLVELVSEPHLLLQCLDRDFAEQQAVFQQARDQKLVLDALSRAEASLRDSQQQLDLIMRQAPAVFWCTDADGRLTYCSGSAREVFAAGLENWVGEPMTALFREGEVSVELVESAHEIALAGEPATFDVRCGERSFDVRVEPLYADGGESPIGAIGVGVESTERVKAEADAAAALQAKTDFVTGISHEIRTPMNAIMGLTELALDLPLSPEQQVYLKSAISSGESLLSVIDQLLDFSKIERGSSVLDRVPFSLSELMSDVTSGLAVHAHGKGVELVTLIDEDVPDGFVGDSGRLRQILVNLAGNAIKFTHEGEVCIRISQEQDDLSAPRMQLHVVVSDTGIGVLPEKQELIFDAFRQAEPGTIRKYGGTGLGLSIALELTRLLGGRIWVVSPGEDGVGSDFHFTVLLEAATTAENAQSAPIPREVLPSSCLLLGIPGSPLVATRRLLESQFGEITEMTVDLDCASPIAIPVADATGTVVLEIPADREAQRGLMDALEVLPDGAGSVIAVCPVGMAPAEMATLRHLSDAVVLKPVRVEALRTALLASTGAHHTDGAPLRLSRWTRACAF